MKKVLWLDLEETIIQSWDNPVLIPQNVVNIRRFITSHNITEVFIFSFAIWDKKDAAFFRESGMKHEIEQVLGVRILSWPSIGEMRDMVFVAERIQYDSDHEFTSLNGKLFSFIKLGTWVAFPGIHSILIDDTVPNMDIDLPDMDKKISLISVDTMNKVRDI
jgi:hypothetical protein